MSSGMSEAKQTESTGRAAADSPFATIEEAIEEIRRGRMVVVCDGEDRENEGDLVMAAQFESLRDPFIILFSIPLAFIGVVPILFLTNTTFNMQGFLGVIILVGIVVNNAIVLIDYANQLIREHGMPLRDAVVTAGIRRLRPILMTTVTTVLGLVPMALGLGEGGELQAPLARVIVGGLSASTLITLIVVPVAFYTLELRSERAREASRLAGASPELQPMSGD